MSKKVSKRYKELVEKLDSEKIYSADEVVSAVKDLASAKFDETVEISMKLNVDPKHADQMVRGSVVLPSGTGKTVRVAVIAKDAKADEAKAAGADIAGGAEIIEDIQAGKMDFDVLIATMQASEKLVFQKNRFKIILILLYKRSIKINRQLQKVDI